MIIIISSLIITAICIIATAIINTKQVFTDTIYKNNSIEKTVLKITIYALDILMIAQVTGYIIGLIKTSKKAFAANEELINVLGIQIFGILLFTVVLTFALTIVLVLHKGKQTLYLNNNTEATSNNLCDYCALKTLNLEKNSIEEDEILQLLKENPEKLDYVKKLLK